MKYIFSIILILSTIGCTSRTEFGSCVGIGEQQKSNLKYKISGLNLFLSVIFFSTMFVPVIVAVNETFCPVGSNESNN